MLGGGDDDDVPLSLVSLQNEIFQWPLLFENLHGLCKEHKDHQKREN
jgi:hypothetical protein